MSLFKSPRLWGSIRRSALLATTRVWACAACAFAVNLPSAAADPAQNAQGVQGVPGVSPEPPSANGGETSQPPSDPAQFPLAWKVWPLFDPFVSRRERSYSLGREQLRSGDSAQTGWGYRLGAGETIATVRPGFWVNLEREFALRIAQHSTYMLELSAYRYQAGLRAWIFELGPGVGVVPLGVDFESGDFSVSALSPSAQFRVGFKVLGLRVSVDAYNQYTWRIWGGESLWVRGVAVQIAVEQPRVLKRNAHPLILQW